MNLTEMQRDALVELLNIGFGRAGAAARSEIDKIAMSARNAAASRVGECMAKAKTS